MDQPILGVNQWFHYEDHREVERTIRFMEELGTSHLRTGVSWADYHRPRGQAWYDWQMRELADAGLDVLLSVWHTPPSLGEAAATNAPPRRLQDYADFIWTLIHEYGDAFNHLELWNEPNNWLKWNFKDLDPEWRKFARMIDMAAHTAHLYGRDTVLGGMIPVDADWLRLMRRHGALDDIDAVAIHGFPAMWWPDAPNWDWYAHWGEAGWQGKVDTIKSAAENRPIWVTETGLATCDVHTGECCRHDLQVEMLEQAASAPAERVYWYSVIDLDPARDAIEGFHADENEYHLGLVTFEGEKKPAFERFQALIAERGAVGQALG